MKKLLRWLLIVMLVLVVVGVAAPLFVRHQMHRQPEWYPTARLAPDQRAAAANRADQKLIAARSEIAEAYASQTRQARAGQMPTTSAADESVLSLTQDEIDAWLPKWESELGLSQRIEQYLEDPTIIFRDQEIILAATVKDWNTIVSLHFVPQMEAGKLHITLSGVNAGMLPLPRVSWSGYQDRLLNSMNNRLADFQRRAEIDPAGRANSAAVLAAMSELLIHALKDEPAEPVLFLPDQFGRNPKSLPVKITDITVANKTLNLTVRPMDVSERAALLENIRGASSLSLSRTPGKR
jgi:hypothetical protein